MTAPPVTSGQFDFDLEIADHLREAFERILINPAHVTFDKIESAIRSCNLMLHQWAIRGVKMYEMQLYTLPLVQGQASYQLPIQFLRPFTIVRRQNNGNPQNYIDIPVLLISREDYENIPSKQATGLVSEAFWDPGGDYGVTSRTIYTWPVSQNSTDSLRMWMLRRPEHITQLPQTAPIGIEWEDAFCAGLAARLAEKYAPAMYDSKVALAEAAFTLARQADRDRAPLRMRVSTRGRRGWR